MKPLEKLIDKEAVEETFQRVEGSGLSIIFIFAPG